MCFDTALLDTLCFFLKSGTVLLVTVDFGVQLHIFFFFQYECCLFYHFLEHSFRGLNSLCYTFPKIALNFTFYQRLELDYGYPFTIAYLKKNSYKT